MEARKFKGFSFRSIWMTILGIVPFRLATANTQDIIYLEILAIAGVALATAPWVVLTLITTTFILTHNAGVCDLTWLVMPPPMEEGSYCDEITDSERRLILKMRKNEVIGSVLGYHKQLLIQGTNIPKLQRNRTV